MRFRWRGSDLEVEGLGRLPPGDQYLVAMHLREIAERLAAPGGEDAPLAELGIETVELITGAARARAVIRALPEAVGLDVETAPIDGYAIDYPWLRITIKGLRARLQPELKDKTALNPRKARARLVQAYDPARRAGYVFDLRHVPLEALAELWSRQLWIHNAGFELTMLGAQGVELPDVIDTQQLAGLVLGCAPGARRLENVSEQILEVALDKAEQRSNWAAPRLTEAQITYAALDAAVAYHAGQDMCRLMDRRLRRCFRLQNRAVPVVAKMRLAGAPFDRGIHLDVIAQWERELAEKRVDFINATGEEPPARHQVGAWIEAHLPADEIAWMPRNKNGTVSARSDLLKYLAHHEAIRPLLRVLWARKRLENFGHKLLELVDPRTSRIYPDYLTCGAKTGRLDEQLPECAAASRGWSHRRRGPAWASTGVR